MIHLPHKRSAVHGGYATAVSLAVAWALAAPAAPAQEAQSNTAATLNADVLQQVTVTANRVRENQQNVPIAVDVISAAKVQNVGITDALTLADAVPGLNFNRQSNASIPFLRGIGTPVGQAGDEPSVALYVDGVYMPAPQASLFNLNSIEQIEVDKGPQGTLFGRNATGGVVQVFTRDPSSTPSVDLNIGYANYDTVYYNGYATGQILPTLSGNIAAYASNQSQGWGTNLDTGHPAYTSWDDGGRAKLLWTPSDKTSVLANFDMDATRTEVGIGYRPWPGTTGVPGVFPAPTGFYDLDDEDSRSITRQYGGSIKVNSDFGWAQLVSITAGRYTRGHQWFAYDSVPAPIAYVNILNPEHTWTQELRLTSPDSARIRWITGIFYMYDLAAYDPLNFTEGIIAPLPFVNTYGYQTTKSWSGFADGTYPITRDTSFTTGIRWTDDFREVTAGTGTPPIPGLNPTGFAPAANSPESHTWTSWTYRAIFDHHFTRDVMGYVGYNRGFKSGIYNLVILPFSPIGPPVQPETLDSYTIGAKTEWWDHKLRVNVEGFLYRDHNIQVDEVNGAATFITNAASATFKGVDLDVTMQPVEQLTIQASIELLDGYYNSFPNGQFFVYQPVGGGNCAFTVVPGGPAPCGGKILPPNYNPTTGTWNLKDNKTMQSPPFSGYLSATYRIPSPVGPFDLTAAWTHTGDYYADADNSQGQVAPSSPFYDKQGIIDLVNATLTWTSNDGHWTVQGWGKNLTGQQYWSFSLEDAFETQYSAAAPRTYGVTLGLHW